ncbi:hypothetical protein ASPACDRAFT_58132 [Aspergillus aculeatus ATCC 16872]|uniref:Uncharacterized protein n=1 Tax=Aspergillus aculeatus (strain ATCC 16872 / CBS 172.66 / WB 5094) TaxID=690307 RepID=A0A1L9X3Z3_ASPA1|nr:uncharacterized protein ASPACDRAFT_58132 [Aspergillus aculeatus ATCC 16872]OJK03185.1 hypothetical protein ASPACDRAFT_58132 [Aspergillus aculeatus ATCC 16872]
MDPTLDPPLPPPPRRIHHRASPTRRRDHYQNNHNHHYRLTATATARSRCDDRSSQPSSDPAFFSSDDVPGSGGLENYTGSAAATHANATTHHHHTSGAGGLAGSRKRRYRGTWWGEKMMSSGGHQQQQPSGQEGAKRNKRVDFREKRLVDSGVWMGSDDSLAGGFLGSDASWGEEVWAQFVGGGEGEGADGKVFGDGNGIGRRGEEGERRSDGEVGGEVEVEQQQKQQQHWGEQVSGFASSQGQGQRGTLLGLGGLRRGIEEEPREHQIARAIVNDCLERGDDSVDLSGGNLRSIPSGLLRPLQHLTKLPAIKEPPVTEDVYTSLEPFLRLFLAGNALPKLSGELFELDTLRVLSLRNNKLTEIPPAIRRLTMLQEVNLSVNRLRSLPWELLWLIRKGDLKHLTVRPNPLLQIDDGAHDPEAAVAEWHVPREELRSCVYEGPAPEEAWAPVHVATGPVRRYNAEGVLLPPAGSSTSTSTTSSQPTAMELDADTDTDANPQDRPGPTPPAASRVPSLREVALLSLTRSPSFDLLSDAELAGYPALMLRLLRDAREVRAGGGRSCSVCHRGFVLARTEWIEWWDCSTYENGLKGPRPSGEGLRPLPFRRLGCSWGCVPGAEI